MKVEKLGRFTFPEGRYAYTGSAVGEGAVSLSKRVERHLKKRKVKHWHIDFLLSHTNAAVVAFVAAESSVNKECQVNKAIKNIEGATIPVEGFGASDCKQNCKSHFLYFAGEKPKEEIVDAYARLFGTSMTCISQKELKQLEITVEETGLQNLKELWRIERECFTREAFTKEQIEILLRNPNAVGLLAKINGETAGFTIGVIENYRTGKVGHIYTIDVAVKHRRRGVGVKLLTEMDNIFKKRGAETSYLEVRVDNEAARKLYRKQGYAETESLDDYYSSGVHGFRLKKQLKS